MKDWRNQQITLLHETAWQSWLRDASTVAAAFALIGPGIYLDSAALQWAGFVMFGSMLIAWSSRAKRKSDNAVALQRTPQEAADRLYRRFGVVARQDKD